MAVICVHMGVTTNGKIRPWAKKKNLLLIEDSAEVAEPPIRGKKLADGRISCLVLKKKLLPLVMEDDLS